LYRFFPLSCGLEGGGPASPLFVRRLRVVLSIPLTPHEEKVVSPIHFAQHVIMDIESVSQKAQNIIDYEAANSPSIKKILKVVKQFIQKNRVLCYGGTAINNLLPEVDRFYDPSYDIPDYDFYSETPQIHAMRLADEFDSLGFKNIQVKPGSHLLTFKVFVEFTGVADITYLEPPIFKALWEENVTSGGIHYVTPNFLRMSMYLELSRPKGDVSRWSKVYKRLMLLNKSYSVGCKKETIHRNESITDKHREDVENILRTKQVILLGLHASKLHAKSKTNIWEIPIDVLVTPEHYMTYTDLFADVFGDKVKIVEHPAYAELLPKHADIIERETGFLLVRVFETMACHSFHELKNGIRVASIPTLLQFFFAFVYADAHFLEGFDQNRIICIAQRLVDRVMLQVLSRVVRDEGGELREGAEHSRDRHGARRHRRQLAHSVRAQPWCAPLGSCLSSLLSNQIAC
jgi:hypothetical protein